MMSTWMSGFKTDNTKINKTENCALRRVYNEELHVTVAGTTIHT